MAEIPLAVGVEKESPRTVAGVFTLWRRIGMKENPVAPETSRRVVLSRGAQDGAQKRVASRGLLL